MLFKGDPIKRWILVAPLHDSQEVNRHAIRKQAEVRALELSHVDPNFEILIHDRDDFDEESYARRCQQRAKIKAMARAASDADVAGSRSQARPSLSQISDASSANGCAPNEPLEDATDLAMREYIATQNALNDLRVIAPEPYETIVALTNQRLRRLRMVGSRSGQTPGETLEAEIELFIAGLRERLPTLDPETVEQARNGDDQRVADAVPLGLSLRWPRHAHCAACYAAVSQFLNVRSRCRAIFAWDGGWRC
ncbi:hypothetical protein QP162_20880 [Sphingomonas aurantiaca]|uniref:hypothetical protein n=1 Tax=Sphingomonas aurantiaca TaxID=185949 RepID=UPI002FE379D5